MPSTPKTDRWRRLVAALLTAAAMPAVPAGSAAAARADTGSTQSTADTTYTQVGQDGANNADTTLVTCPQSCEGNSNGERFAVVAFTLAGLPAGATVTGARLELSAWTAVAAETTAYLATGGGGADHAGTWSDRPNLVSALHTRTSVAAGYNGWDVTPAVSAPGTVTFAVRQRTYNNRVYWASRENTAAERRPRLVVTYEVDGTPGWRLVWSDEFSGSTLDTAKWQARDTYVGYDSACITSRLENVFVSGGLLTLRARQEPYMCAGGREYTTGYVWARPLGAPATTFTYGRFEMRAKSPNGPTNSRGLWPAFWMRPLDNGNGEIDVVELPGGTAYYGASTAAVFRDYTPTKSDYRYDWPGSTYPGDGFHTYVTEWEADEIRWYIDGTPIWQRDPTDIPWFNEVFHKPYDLRINFQVGGWLGEPDGTTAFPADFQVDYVRVYQR